MREIKFRAWNKLDRPDNQMYHRVNLTPDAKVVMPDGEEWELPLMQYTGIKDKNGVKIFEGDVLKWTFNNLGGSRIIVVKEPKILREEFEGSIFTVGVGYNIKYPEQCEVIGNIYENPELLD